MAYPEEKTILVSVDNIPESVNQQQLLAYLRQFTKIYSIGYKYFEDIEGNPKVNALLKIVKADLEILQSLNLSLHGQQLRVKSTEVEQHGGSHYVNRNESAAYCTKIAYLSPFNPIEIERTQFKTCLNAIPGLCISKIKFKKQNLGSSMKKVRWEYAIIILEGEKDLRILKEELQQAQVGTTRSALSEFCYFENKLNLYYFQKQKTKILKGFNFSSQDKSGQNRTTPLVHPKYELYLDPQLSRAVHRRRTRLNEHPSQVSEYLRWIGVNFHSFKSSVRTNILLVSKRASKTIVAQDNLVFSRGSKKLLVN